MEMCKQSVRREKKRHEVPLPPAKSSTVYGKLLDFLTSELGEVSPQLIHVDFEAAMINEHKKKLPSTRLAGCNFHFLQSLWRNIQDYPDIRSSYVADTDFAHHLLMLAALAFVPVDE